MHWSQHGITLAPILQNAPFLKCKRGTKWPIMTLKYESIIYLRLVRVWHEIGIYPHDTDLMMIELKKG